MHCALLIGPMSALVFGWGIFRLWRGAEVPALRWLVWLAALVGHDGVAAGAAAPDAGHRWIQDTAAGQPHRLHFGFLLRSAHLEISRHSSNLTAGF